MTHMTETRSATAVSGPYMLAARVGTVLSALVLLFQFITATGLVEGQGGSLDIHGTGAIVLHVVTGLTMVAIALTWRLGGMPVWPTALAAVVFVLTFVQAYAGSHGLLAIHVPGAMVLTVGVIVLTVWSFRPVAAR